MRFRAEVGGAGGGRRTVPFYDRGILVEHCEELLAIARR
jgi:hypothetical protein